MATADLKWLLVKNNNSFLVKRSGVQFSREAGNLFNTNTPKHSGLANDRSVDIKPADKGITLSLKSAKKSHLRKPLSLFNSHGLTRDFRRVAKSIGNAVKGYRFSE